MSATSAAQETTAAEEAPAREPSARTLGRLRRLAAALAILAFAEALGIALISATGDARFQMALDLPTIGFVGSVVLFPAVGALIVQRRPLSRVAWLMVAIGLGAGFGLLSYGYGATGVEPGPTRPGALAMLILSQAFFVPSLAVGASVLLLLFPTDRLLSPRWRIVAIGAIGGAVLYELASLVRPGELDPEAFPGLRNPIGGPATWAPAVEVAHTAGNAIVTGAIIVGALSLVVRYRRSGPVEAAQIRWIALVGIVSALTLGIAAFQVGPVSDLSFGLGLVLLASMPLAIGVAITRYRLYDIDRLINRALVYGSLTAILAGVFTAAVGLAQRVFVAATGQSSDAAIVLTTLVVATLYAPLRRRLEAIVDRRFKYDEHRFGGYRAQVGQVLSVIEPTRAAERLAAEAVAELGASGAAVVDAEGRPIASAGEWPVPAVVRLPMQGAAGGLSAILVGPRDDGRPHDPRSVAQLEEVTALVAAAVRLQPAADRPRAVS